MCSSIAGCLTGLRLECCSPRSHQPRFQRKRSRKPQKGVLRNEALFARQSRNHRPSHFQLISRGFRHTGPLRSLLSASTKPRAELLTGGGKVVLAWLLVRRGRSSPACHVSPPHLLLWRSTITFFLCGGTTVRLIHELAFFLTRAGSVTCAQVKEALNFSGPLLYNC